jgi:hypothetical protein
MSYIGQTLPADTFQGFTTDSFTGDGSATTFTLSKAPFSENGLIVVINNVIQKPTTNFTVSGTTLTIVGTAVASGDVIYATHLSGVIPSTLASKLDTNGVSDALILDADADTTISADTDDQIDFKAGGTDVMSMTATGLTINDGTTITTADNTDTLTLTSTDADASVGPALRLYRNSASPADDDELAKIRFDGKNSAGEDVTYGYIQVQPSDVTDGTEDGFMQLQTMVAGSSRGRISMYDYATVMNEHSQDIDFRVESNGLTHALFVDAGNDIVRVGLGSGGDVATSGFQVGGTTDSVFAAHIFHTGNNSSAAPKGLQITYTASAPDSSVSAFFRCNDSVTDRMFITSEGDVKNHDNSYGSTSDERIKQDIRDSNSQWDDIKNIKIRNYKKKDDVRQYGDKAWEQIGVIAQELETVSPKLIRHNDPSASDILSDSSFGTIYADGDSIPEDKKIGDVKEIKEQVKSVSYSVLYMKAIKALQEAMARIETLETKVKALEDA